LGSFRNRRSFLFAGQVFRLLQCLRNLDNGDPEMLLYSMTRFFKFLPEEQRQAFLEGLSEKAS
jgi:hypothetical protein